MPDPDRLLRTLRQAAQAFRTTPGRRGKLVCLQQVQEVLIAGDLHGSLDNFRALLQHADLARFPERHLVLQELIHGPNEYALGGDKSHQLLDLVAALKCRFPKQVHFLLGNHELAQWTKRRIAKDNRDLNDHFRLGVDTAYGARAEEVYTAYMDMLAACPLALRTPNRVFLSHSLPSARRLPGFDPAVLEREDIQEKDLSLGGSVQTLVWGRDTSAAAATAFLQKVDADWLITGHIPCDEGFQIANERQLILDSAGAAGCYCLFPASTSVTIHDLQAGLKKLLP